MKKKIVFGSILTAAIIILATCIPAVCSLDLKNEEKVTITTTFYQFFKKEEIVMEVSEEEAEEIKDDLEHLQQAFIEGDEQLIEKYELNLIDKGIFSEKQKMFSKKSILNILHNKYRSMESDNPSLADENRLCFVNARGKGLLGFMFDEAFNSLLVVGALMLILCAVLPPLFPILGLPGLVLLLMGSVGIVFSHIIPFRILYPKLKMELTAGDCSITGLNGSQQYTAPVYAEFSGFNGITVNFWKSAGGESDLFLLGFALNSVVP
jgi:hypothetical protein